MKAPILLHASLLVLLTSCQYLPSYQPTEKVSVNEFEQLMNYGAEFASNYPSAAEETCTNYKQLYQGGDWRAGWILALHVTDTSSKHCVNRKEAIQILTTLKTENKVNTHLLWLINVQLLWLKEQTQHTKKISQLMRSISKKKAQIIELKEKNQDLEEKLDALKAIETSINQQLTNELQPD